MVFVVIIAAVAIFLVGWLVLGALGSAAGARPLSERQKAKLAPRVAEMEREQAEFEARKELAKQEAMKRLEAEG